MSEIASEDCLDTAFLDALTSNTVALWTANVKVFGVEIPFKLDTGADVTAITEESYNLIGERNLTTPDRPICGPSGNRLQVKGWFSGRLSHGGTSTEQRVFIINGLRRNLLGLTAITALNLAVRVDAATGLCNITDEYSFEDLATSVRNMKLNSTLTLNLTTCSPHDSSHCHYMRKYAKS